MREMAVADRTSSARRVWQEREKQPRKASAKRRHCREEPQEPISVDLARARIRKAQLSMS